MLPIGTLSTINKQCKTIVCATDFDVWLHQAVGCKALYNTNPAKKSHNHAWMQFSLLISLSLFILYCGGSC